jgi:hypothetical protein
MANGFLHQCLSARRPQASGNPTPRGGGTKSRTEARLRRASRCLDVIDVIDMVDVTDCGLW